MEAKRIEIKATLYTPTKRTSKYWQTFTIKKIHRYEYITEKHALNIAKVRIVDLVKENFKRELKKGYTIKDIKITRNNWNLK